MELAEIHDRSVTLPPQAAEWAGTAHLTCTEGRWRESCPGPGAGVNQEVETLRLKQALPLFNRLIP